MTDLDHAHQCPAPEWYVELRGLLGDVALAAAFTGRDLAELPAHVAAMRARLDAVWAALGELGVPAELLGRVYAAVVLTPPTEVDLVRGREIAALLQEASQQS